MVNKTNTKSKNQSVKNTSRSELSKFSLSFEYDRTYSEVKTHIHSRKDLSSI